MCAHDFILVEERIYTSICGLEAVVCSLTIRSSVGGRGTGRVDSRGVSIPIMANL